MRGSWVRTAARLAAVVLLAVAGLLTTSAAAQAHAVLLFASPAIEGAVPTEPKAVSLVFDEPVQPAGARTVRLTTSTGQAVAVGPASRSQGGRELTVPVRGTLTPGVYTVVWQATAQDGDVMGGSYRFAVGSAAAGLSAGTAGGQQQVSGAGAAAVLRWVLFAAFALTLGGLVGERLAARHGIRAPRPWAREGAIGGLVASLGLAVLIAGGGSLVEGVSSPSRSALFGGRPGALAVAETAAWLVAAVALFRAWRPVVWVGLAAAVVSEGLRAHPATASEVWGPVLTTVHLAAAAVWIGALLYLVWVGIVRGWEAGFRSALADYARLALVLVVTVLLTGTVSGLLLVSPSQLLNTSFGKVLTVKLALVVAVCALAAVARRRMAEAAPHSLVRVEASALVAVLAVTAWLSVTQPPRDAQAALPFAPPATGDAITVGGRADQIGIAATASTGQVVLRLTAPTTDLQRDDSRTYEASLRLADAAGRARTVALRGCGEGCFYAPVTWKNGANLLTVRTAAKGWGGGKETLRMMWPIRPDTALLERTVKAMRAVKKLTMHEQVASDAARMDVAPTRLEVTGDEFVDSEPYATGQAAQTSRFTDAEGHTVLSLGYPGERLALELTLDGQDRVLRETLVAPNHFIRRSFTYPEPGEAD
ncbi:copper resistance CopC/CopD family protein [Streptomyces sp. NPDC004096]